MLTLAQYSKVRYCIQSGFWMKTPEEVPNKSGASGCGKTAGTRRENKL